MTKHRDYFSCETALWYSTKQNMRDLFHLKFHGEVYLLWSETQTLLLYVMVKHVQGKNVHQTMRSTLRLWVIESHRLNSLTNSGTDDLQLSSPIVLVVSSILKQSTHLHVVSLLCECWFVQRSPPKTIKNCTIHVQAYLVTTTLSLVFPFFDILIWFVWCDWIVADTALSRLLGCPASATIIWTIVCTYSYQICVEIHIFDQELERRSHTVNQKDIFYTMGSAMTLAEAFKKAALFAIFLCRLRWLEMCCHKAFLYLKTCLFPRYSLPDVIWTTEGTLTVNCNLCVTWGSANK